jgi:hypothetical protein
MEREGGRVGSVVGSEREMMVERRACGGGVERGRRGRQRKQKEREYGPH